MNTQLITVGASEVMALRANQNRAALLLQVKSGASCEVRFGASPATLTMQIGGTLLLDVAAPTEEIYLSGPGAVVFVGEMVNA